MASPAASFVNGNRSRRFHGDSRLNDFLSQFAADRNWQDNYQINDVNRDASDKAKTSNNETRLGLHKHDDFSHAKTAKDEMCLGRHKQDDCSHDMTIGAIRNTDCKPNRTNCHNNINASSTIPSEGAFDNCKLIDFDDYSRY